MKMLKEEDKTNRKNKSFLSLTRMDVYTWESQKKIDLFLPGPAQAQSENAIM